MVYQSPQVKTPVDPSEVCPEHANFIDSDGWKISSGNLTVRTLWQKTEDRPILTQFNGSGNSGIAALSDQVVIHEMLPVCFGEEVVSLDLRTGVTKWSFPISKDYSRSYERLQALPDGVLIVLDGILIKIDPEGQYVWSNEGFPSRALNTVYVDQDLYFPSKDKVYVVSNETGERVRQIDVASPISVLHGNILIATDDTHLQIQSLSNHKSFVIAVSDPASIQSAWIAPFTDVSGDILLAYDQIGRERSIAAYSLVDGHAIWQSFDYFEGIPVISNSHLFVYGKLGIKILDIATGTQIGSINLTGNDKPRQNLKPHEVWMTAHDNTLVVNVRDTWDIIALEIQPGN
ncbi:MAG: PQQ-binding-like beta-propeller repeat protein [Chloroflexota bacterium]